MNAHTKGSTSGVGTIVARIQTGSRELGVESSGIVRLRDQAIEPLKEKSSTNGSMAKSPNGSIPHGPRTTDDGLSSIENRQSKIGNQPRFIVTLQATSDALLRIPLAITGKWVRDGQEFSITLEDLKAIVRNFGKRKNGEINVDYDHASEMPEVAAGGPVPSAGRIVELEAPESLEKGSRAIESLSHRAIESFEKSEIRKQKSEPCISRSVVSLKNEHAPDNGRLSITQSQNRPIPSNGSMAQWPNGSIPDGRFILYGLYEPTDRARQLIERREYRYISPAIHWASRDKRTGKVAGTTLTSVALTNRPFLEELPQIRLSDPGYQLVSDGGSSEIERLGDRAIEPFEKSEIRKQKSEPCISPSVVSRENERATDNGRRTTDRLAFNGSMAKWPNGSIFENGGVMEKVTFTVEDGKLLVGLPGVEGACVADPGEVRQCLSELGVAPDGERGATFAESGVISFAQARALLSEAEAHGKFIPASEVFRAQAEQELRDAVQAGKILPRQRDDWRKIALSDLPTFHKLMAAQKALVPLSPVGLSGAPPEDVQEQVKFMAEQRMRERQITFGQALSEIGREQPQLVQQYRRAVSAND